MCCADTFDTPVFMLSIQFGSTGPSNITQCIMLSALSATAALIMREASPSVHSLVTALKDPYSSARVTDLGFSACACTPGRELLLSAP